MNEKKPTDTFVGRFDSELDAVGKLRRKRPFRFVVFLIVTAGVGAWWIYDHVWGIPVLKRAIGAQREAIATQRQEIALLETQLSPVKTAAILKYGNADAKAMAQIADDVRRFGAELRAVENKIRALSVSIEVEFATKWKSGKPPDPSHWLKTGGGGAGEVEVVFTLDDKRQIRVPFGSADNIAIAPLSGQYVNLSYRADATPGSEIFGQLPEHIRELKTLSFQGYGFRKDFSESGRATIRKINVRFYVNGIARLSLLIEREQEMVLEENELRISTTVPLPIKHEGS